MHFLRANLSIVLLLNIVGSLPCLNLPSYMEMMLSGIFFFLRRVLASQAESPQIDRFWMVPGVTMCPQRCVFLFTASGG